MNVTSKLVLLSSVQVLVALVFLKGFLLTRLELPDVSRQCQGPTCSSQLPTYKKAVVLIVDAVRYDFLCGKDGSTTAQASGSLMPKLLQWVQRGVRAVFVSSAAAVDSTPVPTGRTYRSAD
jgi:phosphatidylinositol glycan class O